ncbi:MAG: hypothetical protein ACKOXP_07000 [Flavobacteriales bacterium]
MSGIRNGAIFYSDTRIDGYMNPCFPCITKCTQCHCIFWLDEENQVEGSIPRNISYFYNEYDDEDDTASQTTKNPVFGDQLEIHRAKELDLEGIKDALYMEVQRNFEDEHYLRRHLLVSYHILQETGKITREQLNNDVDYLKNIEDFYQLIDHDDECRPFQAELMRFAGKFERALEIMEPYVDEFMGPILGQIYQLSMQGNRDVFFVE